MGSGVLNSTLLVLYKRPYACLGLRHDACASTFGVCAGWLVCVDSPFHVVSCVAPENFDASLHYCMAEPLAQAVLFKFTQFCGDGGFDSWACSLQLPTEAVWGLQPLTRAAKDR